MTRILFVCLGNICRSPVAHGVMQDLVEKAGLSKEILIDSAGTAAYHSGELPDSRMRATAASHGLKLSSRARQVTNSDLEDFDLILAMDRSNLRGIRNLRGAIGHQEKIRLFRDFDPEAEAEAEVPDPYYGGARGFEEVFQMVSRTCQNLLETLPKIS